MIKPNITPGSWKTRKESDGVARVEGKDKRFVFRIAGADFTKEEQLANAAAIAATPDLLEALELALELAGTAQKHFPKSIKNSDRFQLELSRDAIKKALIKAGYTID